MPLFCSPVYQETQTPFERETNDFSRRVITEEEPSRDTDDFHWDVSHRAHLHKQPMSHDASLSKPTCYNCSDAEADLSVSRSISNHISSIILDLKVSQVLMQQAERSLDNAEAAQVNVPCFDEVDAGKFGGVVGRLNDENESIDGAGKALGPPSRNYIPKWTIDEDVESQYSSAQEDGFDSESYPRRLQVCMRKHKYLYNKGELFLLMFICLQFFS